MVAWIAVFVAKKFATQPFFVCCNVCCLVQTQVPLKTVQHTNFHYSFPFTLLQNLLSLVSKNMFAWIAVFVAKKFATHPFFCVLLQRVPYFASEDFPISLHAKCRWLFLVGHFHKNILNIGATIRLFLLCTISATKANLKCEKNRGNLCLISVCKHLLLCYNIFTTEKNCG